MALNIKDHLMSTNCSKKKPPVWKSQSSGFPPLKNEKHRGQIRHLPHGTTLRGFCWRLQSRREEKKRAEKERIMNEEDPEKQRRLEEAALRREQKKLEKKQMKMKQIKVKAM